jgi:septal ring factor EnvC (AmiA/AmiB activator)
MEHNIVLPTPRRVRAMIRMSRFSRCLVLSSFVVAMCCVSGCTKRPNQEELAKLQEAKSAAESAERKLSELRKERMDLEAQLQAKENELKSHETERDELKNKMGK